MTDRLVTFSGNRFYTNTRDAIGVEEFDETMKTITVNKEKLIVTLEKNRHDHRQKFEGALTGYRKAAIAAFEKRLERIKAGKSFDLYVSLTEPKDQTKDYDRVIQMLKWDVADTVELTEKQFANYVQDRWDWTDRFSETEQMYRQSGGR